MLGFASNLREKIQGWIFFLLVSNVILSSRLNVLKIQFGQWTKITPSGLKISPTFMNISIVSVYCIQYARHYNPRCVYFLPTFWRPFLCFQEGFFSENSVVIYGCYSRAVCKQELVMMVRVRYIMHHICMVLFLAELLSALDHFAGVLLKGIV